MLKKKNTHFYIDKRTHQTAESGLQRAMCEKHDRWPRAALLLVHLRVWGWFSLADHWEEVIMTWSWQPMLFCKDTALLNTALCVAQTWVFCKWSAGWTAGRQWAPGSKREGLRPASVAEINPARVSGNSPGTGGSWWQSHWPRRIEKITIRLHYTD